MQCHAQVFDGKLIIGLGNSTIDFTQGQKLDPKNAEAAEKLLKNLDPKKYEAAEPFLRVVKGIGDQLHTQVRGVNTADRLAALLASHRDPKTFRWSDRAHYGCSCRSDSDRCSGLVDAEKEKRHVLQWIWPR